jgi:hypothetical protein
MRRRADAISALALTGAVLCVLVVVLHDPAREEGRAPARGEPDEAPSSPELATQPAATAPTRATDAFASATLRVARVVPWKVGGVRDSMLTEPMAVPRVVPADITVSAKAIGEEYKPLAHAEGWLVPGAAVDAGPELAAARDRSGADGELRLPVRVEENSSWTLHLRRAGSALEALYSIRLGPDMSRCEAPGYVPAGTARLVLRAATPDGKPLAAPWTFAVYGARARSIAVSLAEGRFDPDSLAAFTLRGGSRSARTDGAVSLDELPAWFVEVRMRHLLGTHAASLDLRERSSADVVWTWDGPDPARALRVDLVFGSLGRPESEPVRVRLRGPDGAHRVPASVDLPAGTLAFVELNSGAHGLEIDDPRFEPVRVEGLLAGSAPLRVQLTGSAEIALDVRDLRTGLALAGWEARLARRSKPGPADAPRAEVNLRPGSSPSELPSMRVDPASYALTVSHPDFLDARLDLDAVGRGRRVVRVDLSPGAEIGGRVFDARSGAPAAGALVRLHRMREVPAIATATPQARTGPDGSFRFRKVENGPFHLSAAIEPGVTVVVDGGVIEGPRVLEGIRLDAPPPSSLAGSVLAPADYPLEGVAVTLAVPGHAERVCPIDPSRCFSFDLLPPGLARLGLVWPDVEVGGELWGDDIVLDGLRVPISEQVIPSREDVLFDLDATSRLPGIVETLVLIDGAPGMGCVVADEESAQDIFSAVGRRRRVGAIADEHGVARIPVSSRSARLRVLAADGSWARAHPEPLVAPSATVVKLKFEVELLERAFRPVDRATRRPLARTEISALVPFGGVVLRRRYHTDAEGRLRARLPAGSHAFEIPPARSDGEPARALMEWSREGVRPLSLQRR